MPQSRRSVVSSSEATLTTPTCSEHSEMSQWNWTRELRRKQTTSQPPTLHEAPARAGGKQRNAISRSQFDFSFLQARGVGHPLPRIPVAGSSLTVTRLDLILRNAQTMDPNGCRCRNQHTSYENGIIHENVETVKFDFFQNFVSPSFLQIKGFCRALIHSPEVVLFDDINLRICFGNV